MLRIADPVLQAEIGREIVTHKLNRQAAKQRIDEAVNVAGNAEVNRPRPREKQLLFQNTHITIYRDPDANDAKIQRELLAIAEQLFPEKAES